MLKSLNAVRVLAEFWVVHLHLSGVYHATTAVFVKSLMSFFFVLSGFVMTHAHGNDDLSTFESKKRFWWRRARKIYPVFVFFWFVAVIMQAIIGFDTREPSVYICYSLQLLMLNGWIGCGSTLMNVPSWYITALWWHWFLFPFAQPSLRRYGTTLPWFQITVLNFVSVGLIAALHPLGYWVSTPLPAVRFLEFYIGCITATTVRTRLHWRWPLLAGTTLAVYYVGMFYMVQALGHECTEDLWSWVRSTPFTNPCLVDWGEDYTTHFAWAWAVLIHSLATAELQDVPDRYFRFLENSQILQTLGTFSLQLYLGHWVVHPLWIRLSAAMRFDGEWEMNTMFIAVYGTCYAFKALAQPWLDRGADAIGERWSRKCPTEESTTSSSSAVSAHIVDVENGHIADVENGVTAGSEL